MLRNYNHASQIGLVLLCQLVVVGSGCVCNNDTMKSKNNYISGIDDLCRKCSKFLFLVSKCLMPF